MASHSPPAHFDHFAETAVTLELPKAGPRPSHKLYSLHEVAAGITVFGTGLGKIHA